MTGPTRISMVIDSTVALAAVLPERHSDAAREVLLRVAEQGAIVPAHWHLEVGNILLAAERRGVMGGELRAIIQKQLSILPIATDMETAERAWADTADLALEYGLSLHDAAYLELALRRGAVLATFDAKLLLAAQVAGAQSNVGQ